MRKIAKSELNSLFAAIAERAKLYVPQDTAGGAKFSEWKNGKKCSAALNTVRSAKDFFFPQTENLMDFKLSGKTIEIIDTRSETEDFVLFGVRACDVKSFEILDRVFLSDPVDTYYRNRREHGIIMSLACSRPQETCFVHHSELMQVRPKVILFAQNPKTHSISMQKQRRAPLFWIR